MRVELVLSYRSYGSHNPVQSVAVSVPKDFVKMKCRWLGAGIDIDFVVDEDLLANNLLPTFFDSFVGTAYDYALLMVGNSHGSTGIRYPRRFRSWGKYFGSHGITIVLPDDVYSDMLDKERKRLNDLLYSIRRRIATAQSYYLSNEDKQESALEMYEGTALSSIYDTVWATWDWAIKHNQDFGYIAERMLIDFEALGYPKNPKAAAVVLLHVRHMMRHQKVD